MQCLFLHQVLCYEWSIKLHEESISSCSLHWLVVMWPSTDEALNTWTETDRSSPIITSKWENEQTERRPSHSHLHGAHCSLPAANSSQINLAAERWILLQRYVFRWHQHALCKLVGGWLTTWNLCVAHRSCLWSLQSKDLIPCSSLPSVNL